MKLRLFIIIVVFLAVIAALFNFPEPFNRIASYLHMPEIPDQGFVFGLDLKGGTHLVYEADVSQVSASERDSAMSGVRDVIERRVNAFGVSEPIVQVEQAGEVHRLAVELAGVKDVNTAIRLIGETPYLDFRELPANKQGSTTSTALDLITTGLTGKYLTKARIEFDQNPPYGPLVVVEFNDEGAKLFAEVTKRNLGQVVGIFLDGLPISLPVVQSEVTSGRAQITGSFSVTEAKQLVERLNAGALPVPIKLVSQQTVGATLGEASLRASFQAGLIALGAMAVFMILWYRLPGFISLLALMIYIVFLLAIFKLIPVTLTLAGIAGLIMSLGIALDANVLIFERMKEEAQAGKKFGLVVQDGFARAWTSIRDANLTTIFTSIVLYVFGTGSIKGFALTLMIGTALSMFSSISVTRSFLKALVGTKAEQWRFLLKLPQALRNTNEYEFTNSKQ